MSSARSGAGSSTTTLALGRPSRRRLPARGRTAALTGTARNTKQVSRAGVAGDASAIGREQWGPNQQRVSEEGAGEHAPSVAASTSEKAVDASRPPALLAADIIAHKRRLGDRTFAAGCWRRRWAASQQSPIPCPTGTGDDHAGLARPPSSPVPGAPRDRGDSRPSGSRGRWRTRERRVPDWILDCWSLAWRW